MVRICENCGKEHDGNYGSGRFCCKECARSFSTKKDIKDDLKLSKCIICGKPTYINKRKSDKFCKCNDCLNVKQYNCIFTDFDSCDICYFKLNNVCVGKKTSIIQKLNTLKKYMNFEISDYKTTIQYYENLKNIIQCLIDNGYSNVDICCKMFGGSKKGNTVFEILNIKTRNLSEAVANAFIQGKLTSPSYFYKEIWHTTWENKEFYLRSSYELDYAKELDKKKISYDYENLKIKYFDSQQQKFRCAIPDFYIPSENMIVEIKSTWTLNIQEMKDKVKSYKKLGYNFKLILEHKDTDLDSL